MNAYVRWATLTIGDMCEKEEDVRSLAPKGQMSKAPVRVSPTTEMLWSKYGALMDIYALSFELGISRTTIRDAISSPRNTQPWARAARKALRRISTRSYRFETSVIAQFVERGE